MTNNQNANPDFFYTDSTYNRGTRQYDNVPVLRGQAYQLRYLRPGTFFTINGEKAVVMAKYTKNSLVRFLDSQECVMISGFETVTPYEYGTWRASVPPVGAFVEVRRGEHQGRVGIVFNEGLNSTYVAFPGDRNRALKFSARDLIIRKNVSLVAS